jgi:hypothetical protein
MTAELRFIPIAELLTHAHIGGMKIPAGAAPIIEDRRAAGRDRRIAPRMKTLRGAVIFWPSGAHDHCVVRKLSLTGANIEVFVPALHNTFDLVFDDDHSHHSCRVVWRKEPRIGVRFQ